MKTVEKIYNKRKKYYNRLLEKFNKQMNTISNLRLLVFLLGAFAITLFYLSKAYYQMTGTLILTLILFIYLIIVHNKVANIKTITANMVILNENGLKRINGEWREFSDSGDDFSEENHPYSQDLDIFKRNSLFQLINSAHTFTGRVKLADTLKNPIQDVKEILARQESIAELSHYIGWRQRFEAESIHACKISTDPKALYDWASKTSSFYRKWYILIFSRLLPLTAAALIILAYISPIITFRVPLVVLFIQFAILQFDRKYRGEALTTVYIYKENIQAYYNMLKRVEKMPANSTCLKNLKAMTRDAAKKPAYKQIERLNYIVNDMIANRHSSIYFWINIILLWDYQCMIALEEWKKSSGSYIRVWLEALGELEALSSLSVLRHDNPDWVMPTPVNDRPTFSAKDMGHPLLSANRVTNDLSFEEPSSVLLITGSNMSGKSTLLRTAGINLAIACTGAPVCAKKFIFSPMKIYTCMRVKDDLEENISSFYAEILRIKMIVESSKVEKRLFYLLDEIFKGTNSHDRHIGAKHLIKQLYSSSSIGMVSTHDLELGDLETESKEKVRNYHFEEYYDNDKIFFDYKLKTGISTTRNALYLMKMAGIEIK